MFLFYGRQNCFRDSFFFPREVAALFFFVFGARWTVVFERARCACRMTGIFRIFSWKFGGVLEKSVLLKYALSDYTFLRFEIII